MAKPNLILSLTPAEVGKLIHAPADAAQRLITEKIREAQAQPPTPSFCDCGRQEFRDNQTFIMGTDGVRHRAPGQPCWYEQDGETVKLPTSSSTTIGGNA